MAENMVPGTNQDNFSEVFSKGNRTIKTLRHGVARNLLLEPMVDWILNFFVPRDRAHFVKLLLTLIVLVYVTTVTASVAFYSLFFPPLLEFMGPLIYVYTFPICLVVTVPFAFLLLATGMRMQEANERLTISSTTDSLTGIPNRGAFIQRAKDVIRQGDPPGALLLIDADNFKVINDTHGHQTGDLALMAIAEHLQECIRDGDLVGRIGGEEFGVFLPGASGEQAELIAERIRQRIAEHLLRSHDETADIRFTVSVGGVHVTRPASFERSFRVADESLYAAKAAGRNRVVFSNGHAAATA